MKLLEFLRKFLQVTLLFINIGVSLLGLLVLIIGSWALAVDKDKYKEVATLSSTLSVASSVPTLLIVVGVIVLLFGVAGAFGAILASRWYGRVMLSVYAVILALLIICELAGGIAAAALKDRLVKVLTNDLKNKFDANNDSLDDLQRVFKCCGVNDRNDYGQWPLPSSCCPSSEPPCTNYYPTGCVAQIKATFDDNLAVIAGCGITFAFLQVLGVIASCFVVFYKTSENKYEVV